MGVRNATVLVVDDVPSILNFVSAVLRQDGFNVLEAENGDIALRLIEQRREPIELLVTDVNMEPVSGPQLAGFAREAHPALRTLYISGFSPLHAIISEEIGKGAAHFLPKPFTIFELQMAIRSVLQIGPSKSPKST